MDAKVNPVYSRLCPVCGGEADAYSIEEYGMCSKCLAGRETGLNAYTLHQVFREELMDYKIFFRKTTGYELWGAQETWVKRLLNRENTVIIAPTGMGKTTLLITYALYLAKHYSKKTLFLTPTRTLAKQVYSRLLEYSGKVGGNIRILFYDSTFSKKKRIEIIKKIMNNEYDILVLTNNYMIRNPDKIDQKYLDTIIIDDVDSLLKSNKNAKKLLNLLGYSNDVIEKIREKHRIIWKIMLSKTFNHDEELENQIHRLIEIEEEIEEELRNTNIKQVVIASATGKMRGTYAKILRDLLKIDVSGITLYGRNITDTYLYIEDNIVDVLEEVLVKLGPGGLILLSPRHPFHDKIVKDVEEIRRRLVERGYRIEYAKPSTLHRFVKGEIDYLIGSSSYYGLSVRGIDAPKTIRYIVFIGTPLFTIELNTLLSSPKMLARIALYLFEETREKKYYEIMNSIRRKIFTLSPSELRILSLLFKEKLSLKDIGNKKIIDTYNDLYKYYLEILDTTKKLLEEKKVLEINTLTLYHGKNKYLALIPDPLTYIQGSGRSSRLYLGRMTHGLSIIIEYSVFKNLVKALDQKLGYYTGNKLFKPFNEVDLDREIGEIDRSRKDLDRERIGYRNILVVVESPTKARTIAKFFGKPVRRKIGTVSIYEIPFIKDDTVIHLNIMATRGHLYELTTDPGRGVYGVELGHEIKPVYETIKRCRICGYQFTHGSSCPRCGSRSYIDSIEVINVLRKLGQEAHEIYIATDPDIEGEKIAYDIYLVVKNFNKNIWRIELHEISVKEFLKALENKRSIDKKLVEAEIYRRVLDRLIGFSLSHELWRRYGKKWFGAGRVQTPVLGWIIDRYSRYRSDRCYRIVFSLDKYPEPYISICIPRDMKELYRSIVEEKKIRLVADKTFIVENKSPPPYTTDELLYDASRLGYTASQTMKILQELFESGFITYHRTSSHYISSNGISIAKKYLEEKNLLKYSRFTHWGQPGAHEAIRPVYPLDRNDLEKAVMEGLVTPSIPLTYHHYRIYGLIFKRFIASQMKPYKVLRREYSIYFRDMFLGKTYIDLEVIENGYNLVYNRFKTYPVYKDLEEIVAEIKILVKKASSKTPLYSEGDLVAEMKKQGLGRPSTYSKILSSISRHGYVIRSKKRNYLIPTKTGIEVYRYLSNNYPELVSIEVTRKMEENIDLIASGKLSVDKAVEEVLEIINNYRLPLSIEETGITIV